MRLISLQSGSSGNSIFVESQGVRLLFDAGISGTQAAERLENEGIDPMTIQGLIISHNHSDHVRCAETYSKRFRIPLFITPKTLEASRKFIHVRRDFELQHFRSGDAIKFGPVTVETIGTPHDATDGVVFVVDDGKHRLGICTDVGHVFSDLRSVIKSVDALFLESNFDEKMLANGYYPERLKRRIAGPGGHISNREAAELIAEEATDKLQWVCLAHLSEKNNTQKKALAAHREALGAKFPLHMTYRYRATKPISIGEATVGASDHPQMAFDFADF